MGPAIRMCVPAWLITALVALVSLVLGPPSRLGALGWALASVTALLFVGVALRVRTRRKRTSFDELLGLSYLAVVQIALMQWLTAGSSSPLGSVLLLWAVYTACVHPPRRTLPYLGFVALAAALPFVYQGWDSLAAAQLAVQLVLWFALAMFATGWTDDVRSKRLVMQYEGDHARHSARTDRLTGLSNRWDLDETLAAELELDRCFRWEGDEFVIVLPDTNQTGAEDAAARLRRTVQASCQRPDGSPLTITTGTAQAEPDMDQAELLGTADLALMSTKAQTRKATPHPIPERQH